jgi:hypothetical protein
VDPDSLEIGEIGDGGRAKAVVDDGGIVVVVRPAASILELVGTCREVPGDDASSGLAMRKPPKD